MADALSPGDKVELSLTMEVKTGGSSMWVKVGVETAVRPDETAQDALDRADEFVVENMEDYRKALS